MFCEICGKNIDKKAFCPYCLNGKSEEIFYVPAEKNWEMEKVEETILTSRFVAGVLQVFLGSLGIGRFYMRSYKIGILQILASAVTIGFGGFLWGVIDGFMILSGKITTDGRGKMLGV